MSLREGSHSKTADLSFQRATKSFHIFTITPFFITFLLCSPLLPTFSLRTILWILNLNSWPLPFPPQWNWRTKTWMTSWTTTGSVLYPCRPSPKLHREVPKKKKERNDPPSSGCQSSLISDFWPWARQVSYWSLRRLNTAQKKARSEPSDAQALTVNSVYLT